MAMKKPLTELRERFCREYLIDLNATKAVVRAGYSKRGAAQMASFLLSIIKISARIQELQAARAERTDSKADRVIQEIKQVAFSEIGEFLSFDDKDGVKLKNSDEIPIEARRAIKSVSEVKNKAGGRLSFRLHSKIKALELLMRHHGMFHDKLEVTDKIPRVRFYPYQKGKN